MSESCVAKNAMHRAVSYKSHFSRSLSAGGAALAQPERIHLAAHSHYLWPNASFEGQVQAWEDAARLADRKWDHIFSKVWPAAQQHIARTLHLSDPRTITFSANTHDFLVRIVLSLPVRPVRVLTTDSEFHSFSRQAERWEEEGMLEVTRVPVEPAETFEARWLSHAQQGVFDLVFLSEVFFRSGHRVRNLAALCAPFPNEVPIVVDGYHSFMAIESDYSALEKRVFYTSGGYKYAMSGEGICFLHAPPGYIERPLVTGWYASFGALSTGAAGEGVAYGIDGSRFLGSTFDASGLYRFVAVHECLRSLGLNAAALETRAAKLAQTFCAALESEHLPLNANTLLVADAKQRGQFLTFQFAEAAAVQKVLLNANIVTDVREDRLRVCFGLYHDEQDMPGIVARLRAALT
jgi:kynureninase